jgi:hypothetical protein
MFNKIVLLGLVAVALAGCQTAAHTVSVDTVRSLRVERVDLTLDPAAKINWGKAQDEYAEVRRRQGDAQATTDNVVGTPGFRTYAAGLLQGQARAIIEPKLRSALTGSTPVVARIRVLGLHVPGLGEHIALGLALGAGGVQSRLGVTVDFVDARSVRSIVVYQQTALVTQGGQKIAMGTTGYFSHDPIERMFSDLGDRLPAWLLKT